MGREKIDRHNLAVIHGGNDMPLVRRVKLSDELLGINRTEHPLPEILPKDTLYLRTTEQHEAVTFGSVELLHLKLELTNSFTTSFGTIREKDVILVMLKTTDGEVGVGECPVNPNPDYNEESAQITLTALDKHLIPRLRRRGRINNVEDLIQLYEDVKGNFAAKTGIESAYWDLQSRIEGVPLYKYWGGRKKRALAGVSIGAESVEEAIDRVDRAVEIGFPRVKLKIKPGLDIVLIDAVRSKYPDLPLQVDANAAYTIEDVGLFQQMDKYGLILIEQPFSSCDLLDHARLQTQIKTSICLDESLKTYTNLRQAIELWAHIGRLDGLVVNIKPPRIGGYWEAVKFADLCQDAGVRAFCGGMLDTAWTKLMNIQLSSHLAFVLPGDHAQQAPYYVEDIASPPVLMEHGVMPISQFSQREVNLDLNTVAKRTVASKSYSLND